MTSKIEWTDETINPIRARTPEGVVGWHCQKVSPGCAFCYADSIDKRLGTKGGYVAGHDVESFLDKAVLFKTIRKKRGRKIFVCSMTDLWADFVEDDWIDFVLGMTAIARQHTYQFLTKRPERLGAYFENPYRWALIEGAAQSLYHELTGEDPSMWLAVHELPNVWFGTSTETQPYVDERTPEILAAPGPVRFLSVEPLLGAVDISAYLPPAHNREWCETHGHEYHGDPAECLQCGRVKGEALIDWVIIGHESGQHARYADIAWTRDVVEQCRAAGVPCFVKQLGRQTYDSKNRLVLSNPGEPLRTGPWPLKFKHSKGGDPDEWPPDLVVRQFPRVA